LLQNYFRDGNGEIHGDGSFWGSFGAPFLFAKYLTGGKILDKPTCVTILALMRGEFSYKILSAVDESRDIALDLLGALIVSGEALDRQALERVKDRLLLEQRKDDEDKEQRRKEMCRFYAMVRYLENDGLIEKRIIAHGISVFITSRGKEKLRTLEDVLESSLPSARSRYENSPLRKEEGAIIVTFDVPEDERRKRDWLRATLRDLGFSMIHKSVWMNNRGIPQLFLEDIASLGMQEYVQVLCMTKAGHLKKIL